MGKYLCYVEGSFAHFTDNLEDQWGDDWDDKPYEHNAGEPYTHGGRLIKMAAFRCESLKTPAEIAGLNSTYSVEDINDKKTPWLTGRSYTNGEEVKIYAGTTMSEFIETIMDVGGEIYLKV